MSWLPVDTQVRCGWRFLSLPPDHPFTRGCALHDYDFDLSHGGTPEHSKDDADFLLFWRWVLIAKAESDPDRRRALLYDICMLWPVAQVGGHLMWDGDPKQTKGESDAKITTTVETTITRTSSEREGADSVDPSGSPESDGLPRSGSGG